jgi:hypothetical protein
MSSKEAINAYKKYKKATKYYINNFKKFPTPPLKFALKWEFFEEAMNGQKKWPKCFFHSHCYANYNGVRTYNQKMVKDLYNIFKVRNIEGYAGLQLAPGYDYNINYYYVINPEFTEWLINETERLKNPETKQNAELMDNPGYTID